MKNTARMNHPYVKNFREERELTVILIVDISASCRFGSTNRLKKEIIAEISALFAFSAIKNNDKVGLILFSDTVEKYLPPKKGVKHVLRVIRELLFFESKGKGSNIKEALSFFGKIQHRSAVCFLLSDFICPDYSWEASLLAKRHDLISIAVTDPCEIKFPALNLVNLSDLETGEIRTIDTSSPEVQTQFQEMATQRLTFHRDLMTRIGAGFIDIRTNQSYLPPLRKFFKMREKKR